MYDVASAVALPEYSQQNGVEIAGFENVLVISRKTVQ